MRYVEIVKRLILLTVMSLVVMTCVSYGEELGTVNGSLEIAISKAEDRKEHPEFLVTFRNVGSENFVLNLGDIHVNGKEQYPTQLKFTVTEAGGNVRQLQFIVSFELQLEDQLDDYIVSLGVGSTYTLTVSLDQLWDVYRHEYHIELPRGEYHIQASYTGVKSYGRVKLLGQELSQKGTGGYWTGQTKSNILRFLQE
jgi:hypothetical protein